jgi:hypothetical protein
MQHRGRHEAAEARASGFASAEAASAMGRLHGISASATKQTRKLDLREELHAAKVERARARREQKLVEQKRREILDELVGLIRDDATPAKLALCPAAAGDRAQLAQLAHATIEDVVRFLRFFEERFFFVGFFSFVGFFFRWLFLPLAFSSVGFLSLLWAEGPPGRGRCWPNASFSSGWWFGPENSRAPCWGDSFPFVCLLVFFGVSLVFLFVWAEGFWEVRRWPNAVWMFGWWFGPENSMAPRLPSSCAALRLCVCVCVSVCK